MTRLGDVGTASTVGAEMANPGDDGEPLRPPLLLYLASATDVQRFAAGPVLAWVAERAGWSFECYYDAFRAGRHFGSGEPELARPGWPNGSLVLGGAHAASVATLVGEHRVTAVGDPASLLWPILDDAGVECLTRSTDPIAIQRAVIDRLGVGLPELALVLDGSPQGAHQVITAPFLYPRVIDDSALALDVSSGAESVRALVDLGVRLRAVACDPDRLARFSEPIAPEAIEPTPPGGWGAVTAAFADASRSWGRGIFVGDPDLAAANLAKSARIRLLPLYGRPTKDVVDRVGDLVEAASEPVFGRQWDDHDFFVLARLGHGLQVVDPPPPFDARKRPVRLPRIDPVALGEPSDEQLRAWALEGRVLTTLLFWTGMLRELDGLPRLIDLIAASGIRAGLVVTAETVERLPIDALSALVAPWERGGVLGRAELLVGSTGRGVAAESLMPAGTLAASLAEARGAIAARLPNELHPTGWWPLLDAPLRPVRRSVVGLRRGRPIVWFTPREAHVEAQPVADAASMGGGRDARALVGSILRRTGGAKLLEIRRPFQDQRPGAIDLEVAAAVERAGFGYMWTKAAFGQSRVAHRNGSFVALPFTAGRWDGWSPFYTVGSGGDIEAASRRARGPGWLVSTVDSPLFAMSGELLEHGHVLHGLAQAIVDAEERGLVNVLPRTVARYAVVLDDLARRASSSAT